MDPRVEKLQGGTVTEVGEVLNTAMKAPESVSEHFLDAIVEFTLVRLERLLRMWTEEEVDPPAIRLDPFSGAHADRVDEETLAKKALSLLARIDPSLHENAFDLCDPWRLTAGGRLTRREAEARSKALRSVKAALLELSNSRNPRIAGPASHALKRSPGSRQLFFGA